MGHGFPLWCYLTPLDGSSVVPSEKAASVPSPNPMEPSDNHSSFLDSRNICVLRLNSAATGSLTCRARIIKKAINNASKCKYNTLKKPLRAISSNLLEANVHIKSKRLPWVADRRDAELPIGWCNAGDQLHCISPGVVSYLEVGQTLRNGAVWFAISLPVEGCFHS